ncbi:site-2 protease family protein [Candidatus Woesearchaeota archaeon]|nr:site-2 protease family protein [Candidatus Woesearchaeota archaeon]
MNTELVAFFVFVLSLSIFLYFKRERIQVQKILYPVLYFLMYRTKHGLKLMDSIAKRCRKAVRAFGYAGIVVGFAGMLVITYELLKNIQQIFITRQAVPGVGVVLPIPVKGVFYVPFFYWIISIFVVALFHEFSHGVVARSWNLKIKSSGIAFLGIIAPVLPAAFVEPDEKQVKRRPHREQLSVFAAGPFMNIILGFLFLGILLFVMAPLVNSMVQFEGIEIDSLARQNNLTFPAEAAGMEPGEIITAIDGVQITASENFTAVLSSKKPGDTVLVETNKSSYAVVLEANPENKSVAYLGVLVKPKSSIKQELKERYSFLPSVAIWVLGLVYWLFLLNFGIGLFNLVPLGPVDGGRMIQLVFHRLFGEKKGNKVWKYVSTVFLFIILFIVMMAFLK